MRAVYFPFEDDLGAGTSLVIEGEPARHLQVVRLRPKEKVLLLNGKGAVALTEARDFGKHQIELMVLEVETRTLHHEIKLAIALPKKDAFEDILKIATELGVTEIFPLSSDYSQYEYVESERTERIIESALIQSNNAFLPIVHKQAELEHFLSSNTLPLVFFDSRPERSSPLSQIIGPCVVLIGPEGGFSPPEIEKIKNISNVFSIHLPTPIQRAPTAVASSIGYLLATWEKGPK